MIRVYRAESDVDLEAWIGVRRIVRPNESAGTVAELRARSGHARLERLLLLAEIDGTVVGSGNGDLSDLVGRASLAPRVVPEARAVNVTATARCGW